MPVIVDTFNVLHQTGVLPPNLAGVDVAGLIDLISRSRFRRSRVRLVCDGTSKLPDDTAETGQITIEFSGHGRTADDVIASHVDRSTAPKRLTIVSSDREVQKAARRRRCSVISSEAFLKQLADDIEREERNAPQQRPQRPQKFIRPLSERDTARWMREFGVDEHAPPLTDEQAAELDQTINKLMGEQAQAGEAAQAGEEEQKLSRDEIRAKRAHERLKKQLDASHRKDGPALPLDLIAEAERLWQHERERHDAH